MTLDTMLLASTSILLSLRLCKPPDQMGTKFCHLLSLGVDSKCLDIPTLLETTSQFPTLQIRNPEHPKNQKKIQGSEKITIVVGLLLKDLDLLDF